MAASFNPEAHGMQGTPHLEPHGPRSAMVARGFFNISRHGGPAPCRANPGGAMEGFAPSKEMLTRRLLLLARCPRHGRKEEETRKEGGTGRCWTPRRRSSSTPSSPKISSQFRFGHSSNMTQIRGGACWIQIYMNEEHAMKSGNPVCNNRSSTRPIKFVIHD
ncbi:uncharacterized protein LOC119364703 isoform X2 [Triticum dicoccoides]|uniref:uncharacterized protein LOC119364703 isoform X2 n=1 Tax=Triticum dicoccoides TaxID=85692 RepID=UPI00188DEB37|nr:uncharacterized protein LOC119364703 isoform X2 [Triticum dicoccoides]